MLFNNREEAGIKLANILQDYKNSQDTIVVALPRGGVPIAFEIAKLLNLPLTLFFTKKIPSPFNEEFAIGAVSENGLYQLNKQVISSLNITNDYLEKSINKVLENIATKKSIYNIKPIYFKDKTILLVDDGIATGSSIYLAAKSLLEEGDKEVIIVSAVAPSNIKNTICKEFKCVILHFDPNLMAVGRFYKDFHQLDDNEVLNYINQL